MFGKLGWSSSAAHDETHWVEDEFAQLPSFAARIGNNLVLVRDGRDGLQEIEARRMGRHARPLGRLDRWVWLPAEHYDDLAQAAVPRLTHD